MRQLQQSTFKKPNSHPNGFHWGHQCSWALTPANSMQVSHAVWRLQQEVNWPKARFQPTLPMKSGVDGAAISYQKTLVSHFTYTINFLCVGSLDHHFCSGMFPNQEPRFRTLSFNQVNKKLQMRILFIRFLKRVFKPSLLLVCLKIDLEKW